MYHDNSRRRRWTYGAVAAAILLMGLSARPAHALPANALTCKKTMAKSSATFERAKLKALQKCEDKKRKGKMAADTDCQTEAVTTAPAITKALTKLQADISKDCCGSDKACGSGSGDGADLALAAIGWAGTGAAGNPVLAKRCSAGDRPGEDCARETECPGQCQGGEKSTQSCTFNSSCQNHACVHANCVGGANNGLACDTDPTKVTCETGGGACPWKTTCDGGSSGNLGICVGGATPGKNCSAKSDCGAGICDNGCNTGKLEDCVAGLCQEALCAADKDCGICALGAFINHSCTQATAAADCGKLCTGGTNDGTPCKVAATDCTGGGSCAAPADACLGGGVGSCSGGFCTAAAGETHLRAGAGICSPADRCPNFENNKLPAVQTCDGGSNNGKACAIVADCPSGTCKIGCSFALTSPADVANCLACNGEASVDQVNTLAYLDLKPFAKSCDKGTDFGKSCTTDTDCTAPGKCKLIEKAIDSCKQATAKAVDLFFDKKRDVLQKCEDAVLKAGSGTCPDVAASDKITTAQNKLLKDIRTACAGKDKAFGGTAAVDLDLAPDSIGNLLTCPNLTVPGAATSCAGTDGRGEIKTLQDLANCLECITEFKVDCLNRMATPSEGALFSQCNPLCGNGKIDGTCSNDAAKLCASSLDCTSPGVCNPIETCDDGNAVSGDACPANCVVGACTPVAPQRFILVSFDAPAGTELAGLSVYVEYPDGVVSIPGSGNEQSVQDRLTVPFDAFSTVNDLNYALRAALIANNGAMFPGVAFGVQVDSCQGASAPTNDQFHCWVESAADNNNNAVSGVTCSVTIF